MMSTNKQTSAAFALLSVSIVTWYLVIYTYVLLRPEINIDPPPPGMVLYIDITAPIYFGGFAAWSFYVSRRWRTGGGVISGTALLATFGFLFGMGFILAIVISRGEVLMVRNMILLLPTAFIVVSYVLALCFHILSIRGMRKG